MYRFLCEHVFTCPECIYLGVELLGYMVTIELAEDYSLAVFQKCCTSFSLSPQCMRESSLSTFLSTLTVCLSGYSHPSGYEVVSHLVLISISLMTNAIKPIFMCLLFICIS